MWLGIFYALVSAISQAVTHAFFAAGQNKLITRTNVGAFLVLAALPACFYVGLPNSDMWPWLAASVFVHAIYNVTLIKAYETVTFSSAYPIARGTVPLLTTVAAIFLLDTPLTVFRVIGIAFLTIGLLSIARQHDGLNKGLPLAFVAGGLTTVYTLIDSIAVRQALTSLHFIAWFFLLDGALMVTIAYALERKKLWSEMATSWRYGALAGLATAITYGTFLVSLRYLMPGDAVALRETSVFFAVVIAAVLMGDPISRTHWAAVSVIVFGAAMVAGTNLTL